MKHIKINTLNQSATDILRANLVKKEVPFKQLGTAFILIDSIHLYYQKVFKGLWLGADANMELQELNKDDLKNEIYVH